MISKFSSQKRKWSNHSFFNKILLSHFLSFRKFYLPLFSFPFLLFSFNFLLEKSYKKSERFSFQDFEFETNGVLGKKDFFKRVNLKKGDNLIAFDIRLASQKILSVPSIKSLKIRKLYPSSLRARIKERIPILELQTNQKENYVLDSEGILLKRDKRWKLKLPKLKADFEILDLKEGMLTPPSIVSVADFVLKINQEIENLQWLPMHLFLENTYSIKVRFYDGVVGYFGIKNYEEQIQRYVLIREEMFLLGKKLSYVNLFPNKNISYKLKNNER